MNSVFIKTLLILAFTSYLVYGYEGELRFFIDDNSTNNYKIIANRISMNDPLFGQYFMMIDPDVLTYNNVTSNLLNAPVPQPFDFYIGFDFVRDQGSFCWPFIGEGKYEITIYRNDIPVFSFKIDLIHYVGGGLSPDIDFEYTYAANELYAIDIIRKQVFFDDWVYSWEMHNQTRNLTAFQNEVLITNLGDGVTNNGIVTKLEQAQWGFPYDHPNYPIGTEFVPGDQIHFWRGASYGLSISPLTYIKDGLTYKFRNWDDYNDFSPETTLQILSETSVIRSLYYPTQPLTVTNNLEGGNGGTYKVTWDKKSNETQTISSGQSYYAFEYNQALQDVFTLEIQDFSALNTNWDFLNWSDGLQSNTRIEAITANNKNFTAIYKGHFRSDNSSAYTSNSQQKTIRDNNGYYHTVYSSMGNVWYTYSLTTDFNENWSQEEWIGENAKNPAIDFYGNNIVIVLEHNLPSTAAISKIEFSWDDETGGYLIGSREDIAFYPSSFFGNAKPVIAYTNGEVYVAYKESASSTLKYWRKYQNPPGQWNIQTGDIPNTTSNSLNVTLSGNDANGNLHIAWQERNSTGTINSIKYLNSTFSGTARDYSLYTTISSSSGFIHNLNPSISVFSNIYPIVSWTGWDDESQTSRTVVRPKSSTLWGSYMVTGSSVGNTVNQSVTNSDNTVIAWSENNGSSSKYAKRIRAQYKCVGNALSDSSTDVSLSGGNSLSQIKAIVFKGTGTPPYLINKSTIDFSSTCIIEQGALNKITANDTIVTFGRSGVVSINDIEFIFEIGDILVGDSIVKFIEVPDTLAYNSANELNQHTRTNSFTLTPATNFYFSNIYHVVQKSNPDTALTTTDAVNFKVELINAITNQVIGTFDNITYNKNNLDKYANVDYEVDCSGITAGEYYLRLVTSVNGNTSYALSNIYNLNTTLAKKNFNQVNFTGSEIPTTYDLAQNFPNPFNPSTTIRYQIPQDGIVTLKIYDILGSEVATLVNEEKVVGKYEVNFNASSLASGVYIYKIQAGSFINSKKMILLK